MTTETASHTGGGTTPFSVPESAPLLARMAALARNLPQRMRERPFWVIQGWVLGITLAHVLIELWAGEFADGLQPAIHHIPVVLYLGPISYASLRYGLEGAVLTGLWSAVLTAPNIATQHTADFEWLTELAYVGIIVSVGVVMAIPVERERLQRRRAEANSQRLARLRHRLRAYAQLVVRAQEDERRRIARELHDEAAQNLVAIRRNLDALVTSLDTHPAAAELVRTQDLAGKTLAGLRRFSRDLRPPTLDDLGLASALEALVSDVRRRTGLAIELTVTGSSRRLPSETELALYRIGQGALHNVERHAHASRVSIDVTYDLPCVRLVVCDDGGGFELPDNLEDLTRGGKLGLVGMSERAELVGGRLEIHSAPGAGTRVCVETPASGDPADDPIGDQPIDEAAKVHVDGIP